MAEHRLDETEVDDGAVATLINVARSSKWAGATNPDDSAAWLGLNPWAAGCLSWDLFDAVLAPGDLILLMTWKDSAAADAYEAPQYYPDSAGAKTIHVKGTPKTVSRRRATYRSRATVALAERSKAGIKPPANHHSTISSASLRRTARSDWRRCGR